MVRRRPFVRILHLVILIFGIFLTLHLVIIVLIILLILLFNLSSAPCTTEGLREAGTRLLLSSNPQETAPLCRSISCCAAFSVANRSSRIV